MFKVPVCVIAALLGAACAGVAGVGHAAPAASAAVAEAPPLTQLPSWAVPVAYRLALRSDPKQPGYSGTVAITVDLKRTSNHLWLHGKDLEVSSVVVSDAQGRAHTGKYATAVTAAASRAGVARIDFGTLLQPQRITLQIAFSAPYDQALRGYYKVVFAGNAYAMTQMEPISARHAFPCFDEPGFKAPLALSLTIPDDDKAIANAAEASDKPAGNGWKTIAFQPTQPLPTYLYAWLVGPWDIVRGPTIPPTRWRSTPVPVRGVAVKGEGPQMQRTLAMVPDIIEHEEAYYGFGYPFGKLDLAALPDFAAGAMENAGLVTFRDWLLLLPRGSAPDAVRSSFNVIAHELAHQWTGDTVTLKWWNDIWLNEAFATWMQKKVEGEIHPDWRAHLAMIEGGQGAMQSDSLASARMIRQPIIGNGDIETAFDGITYRKGAAVIGMFESFVGPKVFQQGMQAYIKAHAFGSADADALVNAIANAAGKGAAFKAAFKSFLDQNGVPLVATKRNCKAKGGAVLDLIQGRYLPMGSTGDPRRLWGLPVCVRFPNGVQCQLLDHKTGVMQIAGGRCPAWYMPNANGDGYYRFEMAEPDRVALAKVLAQRDAGEQLAYADSIGAAFRRGDMDFARVLAAMRTLAPSKLRQVALAPLGTVAWIHDHAAQTPAQKAAVSAAVAKAYLPRLEALGYQRRAGESADDVLLRSELADSLGLEFEVPQVRAALLRQGEVALRPGDDGLPDLLAANPDLLRTALSVAVGDLGKPAIDVLMAAIPKTTDPVRRNAMLYALSHAWGSEADVVRDFALSPAVKVGEMRFLLGNDRDTAAERDRRWDWFADHYHQVNTRLGMSAGSYLPKLAAGGGCSTAEAQRLEAFFEPKLGQVPGLQRGLAEVHESIVLCGALKAHQKPVGPLQ